VHSLNKGRTNPPWGEYAPVGFEDREFGCRYAVVLDDVRSA
jgi:hypothetical protein